MTNMSVMQRVQSHYDLVAQTYPTHEVMATLLYGSQNYRLDTEDSDVDTKTLLIPCTKDVLLGRDMVSHDVVAPDTSIAMAKDFRAMLKNYLKGNINFVETLYTEFRVVNPKYQNEWDMLVKHRDLLANSQPQKLLHMAGGMARQKYVAMEKHFESKKVVLEKYGYDPKQLHHLCRLALFVKTYMDTLDFKKCLVPPEKVRAQLLELKTNPIPLKNAKKMKERMMNIIDEMVRDADKTLPEFVHRTEAEEFVDEFVYHTLLKRMK